MLRLNQLLRLDRPLITLDVETTGVDDNARITELGFQIWTEVGLVKEWRSFVDPEIPIPAESTKSHGITDERIRMCNKCGKSREEHPVFPGNVAVNPLECPEFHPVPTFYKLANNLAIGFKDCDFAGKNVRFDLRKIASEMRRVRVVWSYVGARIIDADRLEQLGDPRTLSDLYRKHLGKEPEDAHQALADVRMTTEILEVQLTKYSKLPRDLDMLHDLQWPGWIDPEGKFRFVNGVPSFGNWGKHRDKPMSWVSKMDAGYWDFILKSDFSPDIKELARKAKAGQFPEPRV